MRAFGVLTASHWRHDSQGASDRGHCRGGLHLPHRPHRRMKRLAVVAALGAALVLTGCTKAPTSGVVHDRSYSAAWDQYTPICAQTDSKTGLCKLRIPHWTHWPAEYRLDIWRSENQHGWREVTEREYEKYQVGSYYGAEQ